MPLTNQEILDGINSADFTAEEWALAQQVHAIQAKLNLVAAEKRKADAWFHEKQTLYNNKVAELTAEQAALEAELDGLAPSM